jgi:hypothetical protein
MTEQLPPDADESAEPVNDPVPIPADVPSENSDDTEEGQEP